MINLHVMHSWGGGLERWVQDYCRNDKGNTNLILKSIGEYGIPAKDIYLYDHIDSQVPIRSWKLDKPILATDPIHLEYRYIIEEIIKSFNINNIIVSSFIGHSLELLRTNIHKLIICHDFYPFCPMVFAYFKDNCQECDFSHLKKCFAENPVNFFPFTSAAEWMVVRQSLLNTLVQSQISLVIASPFMKNRLVSLDSRFSKIPIHSIPHGINSSQVLRTTKDNNLRVTKKRFHILVLGQLSVHKGENLFNQICDDLSQIADIYLLGCGEDGYKYSNKININVIPKYDRKNLGSIIDSLDIDIALLLSVWTETFSYTLSELMCMNLPTLATNVGSFQDRIQDGINGFLVNPNSSDLLEKIKFLLENPSLLVDVKNNLLSFRHKTIEEMVSEYQKFLNYQEIEMKEITIDSSSHHNLSVNDLYEEIKSFRNELEYIKLVQVEVLKNIDYKEFHHKRETTKIRQGLMLSKRFKIIRAIKNRFPRIWEYLRKILLKLGV